MGVPAFSLSLRSRGRLSPASAKGAETAPLANPDPVGAATNILEVRTSAGNGGGSELSNRGALTDLFACDLASEIGPSQVRNLYDHNNTRGLPVHHMGGFLDQTSGSDDITLDAAKLRAMA